MSMSKGVDECPADQMETLLTYLKTGGGDGERRLAGLIETYPGDGRLRFLEGSMLATAKRYDEALQAMRAAVDLAPYFWLARFQLGLLELSSGLPAEASRTWGPLGDLASNNPLHMFAAGLQALMRDDFVEAVRKLRDGISVNVENPPLNNDMQMMIDQIQRRDTATADEPVSATQLLLQTLGRSAPTKH
jgi:Flp pilus assembly protein TadD